MNKKIIKYFIWTIIIAAVLILIQAKSIKSVNLDSLEVGDTCYIDYSTYAESGNLFCLNHGQPYFKNQEFKVVAPNTSSDLTNNNKSIDQNVLNYIMSEIPENAIKGNGYIYKYQIAIWYLTGGEWIQKYNQEPYITACNDAKQIVANAYAYRSFVENSNSYNNIPYAETIEGTSNQFAVYYTKYTDTSITGYTGVYQNLVGVTATNKLGSNVSLTAEEPTTVDNKPGYTHKIIYTKTGTDYELDIKITYEDSARTAETWWLDSLNVWKVDFKENNKTRFKYVDIESSDPEDFGYRCTGKYCGQTPMGIHSISDSEIAIKSANTYLETNYLNDDYYPFSYIECEDCNKMLIVCLSESYNGTFVDIYVPNTESASNDIYNDMKRLTRESADEDPQNLLYGKGNKSTKDATPQKLTFNKPVTLNFEKRNFNNTPLSQATISVAGGTGVESLTTNLKTSGTDGSLGSITVMPTANAGSFQITLTETGVPSEYKAIPATTLTVVYDNGSVISITESEYIKTSGSKVTVKNRPSYVDLSFNKKNFSDGPLSGAAISVEGVRGVASLITTNLKQSGEDGSLGSIRVYTNADAESDGGQFKLKITETTAPADYNKINAGNPVELTVNYDIKTGEITGISANTAASNFSFDRGIATLTLKDDSRIVVPTPGYTIVKTDTIDEQNRLSGVKFKLEFTNIEYVYINGTKYTSSPVENIITNSEGKIVINKIVAAENVTNVTIKITETNSIDGYQKVENPLELTWNYSTTNRNWELVDSARPKLWNVNKNTATITVKNRPAVNISFNKQDFSNNPLSGATITILKSTGVESLSEMLLTSDDNGSFGSITVYPKHESYNAGDNAGNIGRFVIIIYEMQAPEEHVGLPGRIELTVSYNTLTGEVKKIESNKPTYVPNVEEDNTVTIKNRPAVKISFNKQDFSGNKLTGAQISVVKNDDNEITSIDSSGLKQSGSDGDLGTITIYPTNLNYDTGDGNSYQGTFSITVKETNVPTGYKGMNKPDEVGVRLTVTYNTITGDVISITEDSEYITTAGGTVGTVTIKNKPKVDLTINKINTLANGIKIANARFKIELTGVESIEGYSTAYVDTEKGEAQNAPTVVYVKTNNSGVINLTGMVPTGGTADIKVKITEIEVPVDRDKAKNENYYYILDDTPIEFTIKYNENSDAKWNVHGEATYGTKINGEEAIRSDAPIISEQRTQKVTINIKNQPYIELLGEVWNDGQTGEKGNLADPDGNKGSNEQRLEGVEVYLCNSNGEILANYKNELTGNNLTDSNGQYSFGDIPQTNDGYIIKFKYNGITYIETPDGTISKPTEIDRDQFNARFKTISKGESNDNTPLGYTYDESNKTSSLNATINGHTTGTTDAKFQMSAQTGAYKNITRNVHCGLVKKNFDLAIGTDVKNAKLEINGKTTTYNYAQIMDGVLNFQNSSSSKEDIIYNLYLYSSDYNYRIGDYKTDIEGSNAPDSDKNNVADYEELKNLQAYVTYSVILKAQTTQNTTVDEFVYYYDAAYTPYNIVSTDKYTVSIDQTNRKITFTTKGDGFKLTSPNYRAEVELTFKINKDANDNITTKTATNIVEITKYSTDEGGLIDKDSAPANANVTFTSGTPKVGQYEDDTDEAKGLNITIKQDRVRTITGTVFDDTYKNVTKTEYDKDGVLNNTNTVVNDVIVQLIEIKKIGGVYYEYIWQETVSGSNQVKTTARNGYEGTTYTNSVQAGSGKFEFKDFIAGNYIIRYIYGDGTTYDVTDNVKTYNGQDYKSTIDPNYNKAWYNTVNYSNGASVARDNEARRLEVMAFSTVIDATMGQVLNVLNEDISDLSDSQKQVLNSYYNSLDKNDVGVSEALEALNKFKDPADQTVTFDNITEENKYKLIQYYVSYKTWMCAETSRINIPVDADNKTTESDSTSASYAYTARGDKVLFGKMNFGLALRPETNIVLEKHITALKITPSGTGVLPIVDAKALDIGKIVNEKVVEVKGITTGLATIKSTADNRGFWQVATDVEELMQGAELEVEYTYVIRNDSDEDYLSKTLIEAYENQTVKPYTDVLAEIKDTVKATMRSGVYSYSNNNSIGTYLGDFYYTGDAESARANDNLELVSSKVYKFEEALNNDFAFDDRTSISFEKVNTTEAVAKNVYGVDKTDGTKEITIDTVVQNKTETPFLVSTLGNDHRTTTESEKGTADWDRTITLRTTLSTVAGGELGANLPSYIAEILLYSNAAGRKDMTAIPANLSYVHSDDTTMTMEDDNEQDEFWAESIIITKPTGEDKLTPIQIVIITTSAVAALGVGIVLIKKFVLNK